MAALIALLSVAVTGCSGSEVAQPSEPVLSKAFQTCTANLDEALTITAQPNRPNDFLELGGGGKTVTLSTPAGGEGSSGLAALAGACLMRESGAPDRVWGKLSRTNASAHSNEASWDQITMAYSHDAESGLSLVLTDGAASAGQ